MGKHVFAKVREKLNVMTGKIKVYGKKGGAAVSGAFNKLTISPEKKTGRKPNRLPLSERSSNAELSYGDLERIAEFRIVDTEDSASTASTQVLDDGDRPLPILPREPRRLFLRQQTGAGRRVSQSESLVARRDQPEPMMSGALQGPIPIQPERQAQRETETLLPPLPKPLPPAPENNSRSSDIERNYFAPRSPTNLDKGSSKGKTRAQHQVRRSPSTTSSRDSRAELDAETWEYLSPLLEVAKGRVNHQEVCTFQGWVDRLNDRKRGLVKIGEGTYAETYRTKGIEDTSAHPTLGPTVFKIMPLRMMKGRGSGSNVSIEKAVTEIRLMARVTEIPGYTSFREAFVLCGRRPPQIRRAGKEYLDSHDRRLSDRKFVQSYGPNQLWIVCEMQYAGRDLSRYTLRSTFQVWDVFWGVVKALARGEADARFEHRDLHIGNICIRSTSDDEWIGPRKLTKDQTKKWKLGFSGLEVTLIDYTLSRADIRGDLVAFNNIRSGSGFDDAPDDDLQCVTYKRMCAEVLLGDPTRPYAIMRGAAALELKSRWEDFHPRTNVLWLIYLLAELNKQTPHLVCGTDKKGDPEERRAKEVFAKLRKRLEDLASLLAVDELGLNGFNSAADVLQYAVAKKWLDESDLRTN